MFRAFLLACLVVPAAACADPNNQIPFQKSVELNVGQSTVVHGYRGECGKRPKNVDPKRTRATKLGVMSNGKWDLCNHRRSQGPLEHALCLSRQALFALQAVSEQAQRRAGGLGRGDGCGGGIGAVRIRVTCGNNQRRDAATWRLSTRGQPTFAAQCADLHIADKESYGKKVLKTSIGRHGASDDAE